MLPCMHVARVFGFWGRLFVATQCLVGPMLLAISLIWALYTESFLHRSVATTGTIVRNVLVQERRADDSVTSTYAPVFSFSANDGRTYTVTSSSSSSPPEFAVGQQVRVLYVPDNPATAKIDSVLQLWMMPMVLVFLGIICSLVGYGLLLFLRRRKVKLIPTLAGS